MEDILSKVCFAKNESFATSLPPYDLSGNKLIFPSGKLSKEGEKPVVGDTKKVYFCQRCLNHKHNVPRKNHKVRPFLQDLVTRTTQSPQLIFYSYTIYFLSIAFARN